MEHLTPSNADGIANQERRLHDRVTGPFDGFRVAALETPVRIYDLSLGGCFITSLHDQGNASEMVLKIDLPHEGWITVKAAAVYRRPEFGFAVRFVELDPDVEAKLARSLDRLQKKPSVRG
jgi:hypothetical protein